ncbi:hypothetical protein [Flavobacterium hungaricum]|uniref:Uncharacterized protein n=1 Tax=Flavobacterium hungaricum TaxID=2082725 RepID=A0ABR9TR14_9FLAO|nr:hypothetical protein [Flavobacterium hungaricum]MBE8727194.1 hypothetical protein [Flavobacterium hungaricum]
MKDDILNWIDNIQQIDGIPPKEIIAFNFGVFEDENGYSIYLVGSFEYDENDDDWACLELPAQVHRYFKLPNKFANVDWEHVLDAVSKVFKELQKEGEFDIPLFENAIAITTGFDDGDLIKIR